MRDTMIHDCVTAALNMDAGKRNGNDAQFQQAFDRYFTLLPRLTLDERTEVRRRVAQAQLASVDDLHDRAVESGAWRKSQPARLPGGGK